MVTSLLRSDWEAMFQAEAVIIPLPRRLCQAMASQSLPRTPQHNPCQKNSRKTE